MIGHGDCPRGREHSHRGNDLFPLGERFIPTGGMFRRPQDVQFHSEDIILQI